MQKDNISLRLQNARYLNFKHAAPCSHSSGRKWPLHILPSEWPQVAKSISTLKATPLKDSAQQISLNNFGGQEIVKI